MTSIVFDRDGNQYEVNDYEVEGLLESGAYFKHSPKDNGAVKMPKADSPLVTIYDRKTGEAIKRRPVDARELVRGGGYSFDAPRQLRAPSVPPTPPPVTPLPVFSEETPKEDIQAALAKYGLQHRANMSKSDLLTIWNTFLLEQGQK